MHWPNPIAEQMPGRSAGNPARETLQRVRVTGLRGVTGGLFLRGSPTGGLYALERNSGGAGVGSPIYLGLGAGYDLIG